MTSRLRVIAAGPLDERVAAALAAAPGVEILRCRDAAAAQAALEARDPGALIADCGWPEAQALFAKAAGRQRPVCIIGTLVDPASLEELSRIFADLGLDVAVDAAMPDELTRALAVARALESEWRAREQELSESTASNRTIARVVDGQRVVAHDLSRALEREESAVAGAATSTVRPGDQGRFLEASEAARFASCIVHEGRRATASGEPLGLVRVDAPLEAIVDLLRSWDVVARRGRRILILLPQVESTVIDAIVDRVPDAEHAIFHADTEAVAWAMDRLNAP